MKGVDKFIMYVMQRLLHLFLHQKLVLKLSKLTPKQIDLTSIFVTRFALLCKHVIVNKRM